MRLIDACYAGVFPGHTLLGTALQRSISPDAKDFAERIFVGFCMGICLCGIAGIGGFMIAELV